jgi:spore germination cell wall hydrolase CwlJ-like protein
VNAVACPRPCGAAGRAAARAAETLALTLWAEAAGRPVRAIEALAALVANRARAAATDETARLRFAPGIPADAAAAWPLLLGRVCRAPFLFACWNPRHPRHAALGEAPEGDPALAVCRRIARRAAAGLLPDPTGGATHWHDARALPGWALGRVPAAEVGGLVFYRAEH